MMIKTNPNEPRPTPVCGVEGFAGSADFVGETVGVGDADFDVEGEVEGVCFAVTVGEGERGVAVTIVLGDALGPAVGVVLWFFTRMLTTPATRTPAIAKARSF
jgi:hypothetical protein